VPLLKVTDGRESLAARISLRNNDEVEVGGTVSPGKADRFARVDILRGVEVERGQGALNRDRGEESDRKECGVHDGVGVLGKR